MKFIKIISLTVLLFSVSNSAASAIKPDPERGQIITELTALLGKPGFRAHGNDLLARVYFMVNRDSEIVVLQVEAEDAVLESYIKNRLNYKEIKSKDLQPGKEYVVPVRVKSSI